MKKLLIKSFVRLILSYVYAFVGGCILYAIERKPETNEEISSRLSQKLHRDFILKFNISINESDFKCFMQKAFDVVTVGNKMDWSILSGLSFTMTSLTTIGYGHITPETPLGQIVTVLYCLIGLPVAMLTLKTLGEVVSKIVYKFIYLVETRILCRKRPRRVKIKTLLTIFTLMILTLCAGGLTQVYLENWTFIEGFYAWFITLSTIGYGDYLPALDLLLKAKKSSDSQISLLLIITASALPYLAGLCMVSGVLNSLVEVVEEFRIVKNYKMIMKKTAKSKEERVKQKLSSEYQKESDHDEEYVLTMITNRARSASV